jgi:hypothetical protein
MINLLRVGILALVLQLTQAGIAKSESGVFDSNDQGTAGVRSINRASGDGVWGEADPSPGRGVVGVSKGGAGVWGDTDTGRAVVGVAREKGDAVWGETKTGRGVVGISEGDGTGVWGENSSASAAAGAFKNSGSGDLISAGTGQGTMFRVLNNGDILVRGQKIGLAGPQGPKGDQGPPGSPGPAVHTIAVCQSPTLGSGVCPCSGRTITKVSGVCSVSSETGSCSSDIAGGCCAVCAP